MKELLFKATHIHTHTHWLSINDTYVYLSPSISTQHIRTPNIKLESKYSPFFSGYTFAKKRHPKDPKNVNCSVISMFSAEQCHETVVRLPFTAAKSDGSWHPGMPRWCTTACSKPKSIEICEFVPLIPDSCLSQYAHNYSYYSIYNI